MPDLFASQPVMLADQIAEVRHELALRERLYAREVAGGRMTRHHADLHYQRLSAVLATLEYIDSVQFQVVDGHPLEMRAGRRPSRWRP